MKHIVGFSGGADSQATALLVRQRFPAEDVILLNSDAGGNEHPVTTHFIEEYSRMVFPVVTVNAIMADLGGVGTKEGYAPKERRDKFSDDTLLTFDRLAYVKGRFPSRTAQFCTQHLKLEPQIRWIKENVHEPFDRWVGMRCDESDARKDTPDSKYDEIFDCIVHYPIRCWSKPEVFAFIKEAGEEVNPLYKMGFGRVGCAPCVNSGKNDVRNWAARFPEMIDKVRAWESYAGRTFFSPCVPGLELNWIDEVVAWSKTAHGGKQGLMMFEEVDAAEKTCVSSYGLCE